MNDVANEPEPYVWEHMDDLERQAPPDLHVVGSVSSGDGTQEVRAPENGSVATDPFDGCATAERLAPTLIDFGDGFWSGADDAEDFLVAPILARGRGHLIYAGAKSRKSLFVLHLCACIATGRPVLDHPGGAPVRVLYADLEMTSADVRDRLTDMGFGPDDDLSNLAYYSLPSLAALDTPQGGAEFVELALHHRVDLVVVDTISRAVVGLENVNDTAQDFARYTGTPMKAAGITLLRIDHAGKDVERGARGGSAKVDDVDVVWKLTPRDANQLTLRATHRRVPWVPEVVELRQSDEPLGFHLADFSWPAGTREGAALLDRLGVAVDHGKGKARAALKEAGESMGNDVLMASLRYRRSASRRTDEGAA